MGGGHLPPKFRHRRPSRKESSNTEGGGGLGRSGDDGKSSGAHCSPRPDKRDDKASNNNASATSTSKKQAKSPKPTPKKTDNGTSPRTPPPWISSQAKKDLVRDLNDPTSPVRSMTIKDIYESDQKYSCYATKTFDILGQRFRHGRKGTEYKMELHKTLVESICVLVQYDMENGHPLFEV